MTDYGFDLPTTIKLLRELLPLAEKLDQGLGQLLPEGRPPWRKRRFYRNTGDVRHLLNELDANITERLTDALFYVESAQEDLREAERNTLRENLEELREREEELREREIELHERLQALDGQVEDEERIDQ